ncbi:MAG TPA: VWA domain-containing protein [Pirellulales bacterium]
MAAEPAADLETFVKPDGEGYFALKLAPRIAQPPRAPHDLVVLFDTSASQVGAYRTKALGALRTMLNSLDANDRVALMAVDLDAIRLTPSLVPVASEPMKKALADLERRVPLGSTDMHRALEAAVDAYTDDRGGRARSVVYIGDGMSIADIVAAGELKEVLNRLVGGQISVSSYAVGPRIDQVLLGALANHTGGMVLWDDQNMNERAAGGSLAEVARGVVVWPTDAKLPDVLRDVYPRQVPPLRFDRDSVLIGTYDEAAVKAGAALEVAIDAEMAGRPVTLHWQVAADPPANNNAYLAKVVEAASQSDGVALPTVGSEGLASLRRIVNSQSQQLARLGEQALAGGQVDEAVQLARQAAQFDPANPNARLLRTAAMRAQRAEDQPPAAQRGGAPPAARRPAAPPAAGEGGLRLNGRDRAAADDLPMPGGDALGAREAADGELLDEVERDQRVRTGFIRKDVQVELQRARDQMAVDPVGTTEALKVLLDTLQRDVESPPEVRDQLAGKVQDALRAASRQVAVQEEKLVGEQQREAEGEARERLLRELFLQEQKVDQLMARFNALLDEERYRDAEAVANIAEEMLPGRPGLRGAELSARMTGYTADMNAVRDLRHKGVVDSFYQVELSHIPTPDEPPILYPDPEVWQLLTERRKKYKAVDLTQHSPNEEKILQALNEPTVMDFEETPLRDAIDFLKEKHNIEIQLDARALEDGGLGSDTPVTRSLKGISLRNALRLLLGEYELTYVIRNEVLLITSKTEAENMLSTRVYPVGDLVIPVGMPMMGRGGGGMRGGGMGMMNVPGGGMGGMGMMGGGMGMMGGGMGMMGGGMGMMGGGMGMMGGGMGMMGGGMGMMGGGMGGMGMMCVPDDTDVAWPRDESATALVAFAVGDDLSLSKKKSAAGTAAKARKAKPAAKKKRAAFNPPENQPDKVAQPDGAAQPDDDAKPVDAGAAAPPAEVAGPVLAPQQPGLGGIEPIQINFAEGDDPNVAWNDYFASHDGDKAPSEPVVRETVRRLMKARNFSHAIGLIYAALRNQQGQPWMYEVLGIALQADNRTPDEIERVLMSAADFASSPVELMYLGQYMARSGLKRRALALFRQASELDPEAAEPYMHGLRLAQEQDDLPGIQWSTIGILSRVWSMRQMPIWEAGWTAAEATLDRLTTENRSDEAAAYRKQVNDALVRDCIIIVTWNGEADVDLMVEEPAGTICSFRNPRTTSGGVMLGDAVSKSKKASRTGEGAQEVYVCNKGFDGTYRALVRRVWGKLTAKKVTVEIIWHYWSKEEKIERKQIDLSDDEAVVVFDLKGGRRTEPLEEQQAANAVAAQMKRGQQLEVARQLNALHDPRAVGSLASARNRVVGEQPRGIAPFNPWVQRGAVGYQPVIVSLPKGATMTVAPAVVSADRRYVRVTSIPLFSGVTEVNTFNYATGASGTSGGAGGGGFGAGGGRGGLGGF